jgi:hypothetical protein
MELRETGCEDGRWIELAQDCVEWWAMVLAVFNLSVLLPVSLLISKMDFRELSYEDVKRMERAHFHVKSTEALPLLKQYVNNKIVLLSSVA